MDLSKVMDMIYVDIFSMMVQSGIEDIPKNRYAVLVNTKMAYIKQNRIESDYITDALDFEIDRLWESYHNRKE
jgi:hypothetical protein